MQYQSTENEKTFAALNLGVTTFVINTITHLETLLAEKDSQLVNARIEIEELKNLIEERNESN